MQRYLKPERIFLRNHPELSEKWVQGLLADDPSILGLGDLVLRDQERIQPRAGRLDLLLQDPETKRRYEVELQLGSTDEAHIVRTIEYWDIERRRYPQYDHCAVIVAEDITSRFLNIISLFNGSVPLIAIQMQAMRVGENLTLVFTTVVNELTRGLVDADEDAEAAPTDRAYWESKATKANVALADHILALAKHVDEALELRYNKFYIGLSRNGQPYNFVVMRPKKSQFRLEVRLPQTAETTELVELSGIETLDYDARYSSYRLRLTKAEIDRHGDLIKQLLKQAYDLRNA